MMEAQMGVEPGIAGEAKSVSRLRWDGLMISERPSESSFRVNVNALDDPAAYFECAHAVLDAIIKP
jgi:hypothetical protein